MKRIFEIPPFLFFEMGCKVELWRWKVVDNLMGVRRMAGI